MESSQLMKNNNTTLLHQNNTYHRLRIGVLMGGKSIEHEVSFNSGRTVCDHLDAEKYTVIPIYQTQNGDLYVLPWHFLHRGKTTDFVHRLEVQAERISWSTLPYIIDFMYIATHGRYAEDGSLQGILELLKIPYLGAKVFASALRMNKIIQKIFLQQAGISVPRHVAITPEQIENLRKNPTLIEILLSESKLNLPVVVKPHNEGSSLGVTVVFENTDLLPAIEKAVFINKNKPTTVLLEEKISGMEFSCITLYDHANQKYITLPPTEIVHNPGTHFFDYQQKYMPGYALKYTPARCSQAIQKKIQATCQHIMEIMEFSTISRIDGFVTEGEKIVIIDPNSLSGMGPASFIFLQAAEINMSHTELINFLIASELAAYHIAAPYLLSTSGEKKMSKNKTRVAVIMGGASNERETSLESGRNVVYKLSPQKYEAIPLFLSENLQLYPLTQSLLVRNSTKEIETLLINVAPVAWEALPSIADFVFIALHGGQGEDGTIQGALEILNIPYNGSGILTSGLCMNKYKTNEFLRAQGFCVPENYFLPQKEWLNNQESALARILGKLTFPLIVKPHDDGCSVMVQKIQDRQSLINAIENIFGQHKTAALIETCIQGMELTVGVIGNHQPQALPPSQAITANGVLSVEEKFLPGAGENQTPAPLPAYALSLVQRTMENAYTTLQCKGYARIDCFYQSAEQSPTKNDRVVIIEINTLPGLTPATCIFHQAAEINITPMEFIDRIITLGIENHTPIQPVAFAQHDIQTL